MQDPQSGTPDVGIEGYPAATITADAAGLTRGEVPMLAPLPVMMEAGDLPLVPPDPPDEDEPLIRLQHLPRVVDLATYNDAGWPGALPGSWARAGAVSRLVSAAHLLPEGYGLAVFDAWRSLPLQRRIFDHFYGPGSPLERGFVSPPSSSPAGPAKLASSRSTGCETSPAFRSRTRPRKVIVA